MPRGDRYKIPPYKQGPKRTLGAMNADVEILQDVADRVASLEEETESGNAADAIDVIVAAWEAGDVVTFTALSRDVPVTL